MNKPPAKDPRDWRIFTPIGEAICTECYATIPAGTESIINLDGHVVCLKHAISAYEKSLILEPDSLAEAVEEETEEVIEKILGKKHSRFMEFVLACSLFGVIGVIIFLSIDLPSSYVAKNWDIAWVGFDSGLLVTLALTLWAVWKQRQVSIISSAICGSILIIDSWFDVATSHGGRDFYSALATAVFLQVPFALVLFRFSRNVMHRSLANSYAKVGMVAPKTSFFKTPLKIFREE